MTARPAPAVEQRAVEDFELRDPRPDAMIESLRAVGYDLSMAVADLVDNSVSAGAARIRVDFYWRGGASYVRITDDGRGMTGDQLSEAMRLGSTSPTERRSPEDMGRFGLGLKTASFSQARLVSVLSRPGGGSDAVRCWDLDYVCQTKQWRLLTAPRPETAPLLSLLPGAESGTCVLWERMDRLVGADEGPDSESAHNEFLRKTEETRNHLAMVFHRFMSGPKAVKFFIGDELIEPWDPFLSAEAATQELRREAVQILGNRVNVIPYVLPHVSRLSTATYENAGKPRGWNGMQGFYVYRKRRLILPGDWLGLGFKQEEHCKLARILLDIPEEMDFEWEVDVRKSRVRPPDQLRPQLQRIAKLTRESATNVYRHKGKVLARDHSSDAVHLWQRKVKQGKFWYEINEKHPIVQQILQEAGASRPRIRALLAALEQTVPVEHMVLNSTEKSEEVRDSRPPPLPQELRAVIKGLYAALRREGLTPSNAKGRLLTMEPIDQYPEEVSALAD